MDRFFSLIIFFVLISSCSRKTMEKTTQKDLHDPLQVKEIHEKKVKRTIPEPSGIEHKCTAIKDGLNIKDGCEGEGCFMFLRSGISLADKVILYQKPSTGAKKVGFLKKCEPYWDLKFFLRITKTTPVLVIRANNKLSENGVSPGDIIHLTHFGGEGSVFVCLGNSI